VNKKGRVKTTEKKEKPGAEQGPGKPWDEPVKDVKKQKKPVQLAPQPKAPAVPVKPGLAQAKPAPIEPAPANPEKPVPGKPMLKEKKEEDLKKKLAEAVEEARAKPFVFKTCGVIVSVMGVKIGIPIKPSVRIPAELKPVALDPDALDGVIGPLYYMYRDVWSLNQECNALCKKHDLRYDLTVIRPGLIGREYVKTLGHFHERIKAKNVTFPELYEVISGKAMFLIQKIDGTDFEIIEAGKGAHAFVPYNYGHVTVNVGNEPLVVGNLVANSCKSEYEPVKQKHGLAYYVLKDGIVKNPHYEQWPRVVQRKATPGPPIDALFKRDPAHYAELLH